MNYHIGVLIGWCFCARIIVNTSGFIKKYQTIIKIVMYMKTFLNSDWLRVVQFFRNTVPKNEMQCKKKNANFIDYLGFLIGLKYD